MEEKLMAIKVAAVATVTALAAFVGWKGILALVWVGLMVLDYASGSWAACKEGAWSSKTAREGLFHKGGMILVVLVALFADVGLGTVAEYMNFGFVWPGLVLPLCLAWYIITEAGSILENAVKMGAKVPAWLVKLMKVSIQAVEDLGNQQKPKEP